MFECVFTCECDVVLDTHADTQTLSCACAVCDLRAEPLLAQIKGDRKVVLSPVLDRIDFSDLKVVHYISAPHGFDWALWCIYERFSPQYRNLNDATLPAK